MDTKRTHADTVFASKTLVFVSKTLYIYIYKKQDMSLRNNFLFLIFANQKIGVCIFSRMLIFIKKKSLIFVHKNVKFFKYLQTKNVIG